MTTHNRIPEYELGGPDGVEHGFDWKPHLAAAPAATVPEAKAAGIEDELIASIQRSRDERLRYLLALMALLTGAQSTLNFALKSTRELSADDWQQFAYRASELHSTAAQLCEQLAPIVAEEKQRETDRTEKHQEAAE